MENGNVLEFNEKRLFNNEFFKNYSITDQKQFLAYLLRRSNFKIVDNKIIFPDIISNYQIKDMIRKLNIQILKNNFEIQKSAISDVENFGMDTTKKMLKKQEQNIQKLEKKIKQFER